MTNAVAIHPAGKARADVSYGEQKPEQPCKDFGELSCLSKLPRVISVLRMVLNSRRENRKALRWFVSTVRFFFFFNQTACHSVDVMVKREFKRVTR